MSSRLVYAGATTLVSIPLVSILISLVSSTMPILGWFNLATARVMFFVSIALIFAGLVSWLVKVADSPDRDILKSAKLTISRNKPAIIGLLWLLVVPVATILLIPNSVALTLVLAAGGLIVGFAYYQRYPGLNRYVRVLVGLVVAGMYARAGYYYVIILVAYDWI